MEQKEQYHAASDPPGEGVYRPFGFRVTDSVAMPHRYWDELANVLPPAEFIVLGYILRHTWGFHEFDKPKRITLDEFMNGRKRRDGSRWCAGLNMSKGTVRTALDGLLEKQLIVRFPDGRDGARASFLYMLNFSPNAAEVRVHFETATPEDVLDTAYGQNLILESAPYGQNLTIENPAYGQNLTIESVPYGQNLYPDQRTVNQRTVNLTTLAETPPIDQPSKKSKRSAAAIMAADAYKRIFLQAQIGNRNGLKKKLSEPIELPGYPRDAYWVIKLVCQLWGLRPPAGKRASSKWIKDARALIDACGEFGFEPILSEYTRIEDHRIQKGIEPYSYKDLGSFVGMVAAQAAKMRSGAGCDVDPYAALKDAGYDTL